MARRIRLLLCFHVFFIVMPPKLILSRPSGFSFLRQLLGSERGQTVAGIHNLKHHLAELGYLDPDHDHGDKFDDALESAVKTYQKNYQLKVTGELDPRTVNQMVKPRCGSPDARNTTPYNRDYSKTHYTYRISTPRLSLPGGARQIRAVCARAFQKWTDLGHLTFQELLPEDHPATHADIEIGFRRGVHGDGKPFDGPKGVVGHVVEIDGEGGRHEIHLDGDEAWSTKPSPSDVDLESVVVHEIGHVLGLEHDMVRDSVMYPCFDLGATKRDLNEDDVHNICTLQHGARIN